MASTSSESTRRGRLPSRRRNVPEDTRDAGAAEASVKTAPADRSSPAPSDHPADSDESTSLPSTQREPPERVGVRNRADVGGSSWIPPSSIAPPPLPPPPPRATAPAAADGALLAFWIFFGAVQGANDGAALWDWAELYG
nr:unnamed protein product [Digitaria exilis]